MNEPVIKPIGDSVWVIWKERATLEFARLAEHKDSLSAEVSVHDPGGTELHWARVNLVSTQGRQALTKAIEARDPNGDWSGLVDRSCRMVAKHVRTGDPAVPLVAAEPRDQQYVVDGLILRDQLNVLYADGGTGKSYLAMAVALGGLLRRSLSARWRVAPLGRVMYLDWESGRDEQQTRLWRLTQGMGSCPADGLLLHRVMRRPLTDDISAIRAEVAKHNVDFVVADSLAPACGPEPETASAVVPTLLALRSLATTVLILAHISNQSAQSKAPARPFGSVFIHNLCRSTIEARRSDPDSDAPNSYVLTLYHRKNNEGRLSPPSALQLTFDPSGVVTIGGTQPDSGGASLAFQILEALKSGPKESGHLAEELDSTPAAIKKALQRLENRDMVTRLGDGKAGHGKQQQWARLDTNRDTYRDTNGHDVPIREPGDDDPPF